MSSDMIKNSRNFMMEEQRRIFNKIVENHVGYVIDQMEKTINKCSVIEAFDGVIRLGGFYGYDYVLSISDIGKELFISLDDAEDHLYK